MAKKVISKVREVMAEKGVTYETLQQLTGLTPQTIARARHDERILTCTLATLQTIAHALGVRVKDLFEED